MGHEERPGATVRCARCKRPFIPSRLFDKLLAVASARGLSAYETQLAHCPGCRSRLFAERLLGDTVERVPRPGPLRGRRSVPRKAVSEDRRLGTTVYKSQCFICNQGCDALVHVREGRVVKTEGDPGSEVTKGTLCSKGLGKPPHTLSPRSPALPAAAQWRQGGRRMGPHHVG